MLKTITKNELITLVKANSIEQPKAKCSNNVILNLIELINNDFDIQVEPTRSNSMLNRGSIVECLIKLVFDKRKRHVVKNANGSDLYKGAYEYEIKFSTTFAYASNNNANHEMPILLVCESGVYKTTYDKLNINKSNKITNKPSGKCLIAFA